MSTGNARCSELLARTASLATRILEEDAAARLSSFVRSQLNGNGGFRGRSSEGDLYYTLFGLECLRALGHEPPDQSLARFLDRFGSGDGLDLVHSACLVRCLTRLPEGCAARARIEASLARLASFRSARGGYRLTPEAEHDSIYACFVALLAHEESDTVLPAPEGVLDCIVRLRADDGGYADRPGMAEGTTTVTAAAAVLLHHFGEETPPEVGDWLLARHRRHGGFCASPSTPLPDLLSTATASLALNLLGRTPPAVVSSCLGFVEALWDPDGGFVGSVWDPSPDCEYTYYGLLSLGALTGEAR